MDLPLASPDPADSVDPPPPPPSRRPLFEDALGVPFRAGNRLRVLENGCRAFPSMLDAIATSCRAVELSTYVWWDGPITRDFTDALVGRARAGVAVRVLVDAIGGAAMPEAQQRAMREAGVDLRLFRAPRRRPLRTNRRTHRKVLVCDGTLGFTGGMGIASEWQGDARHPQEWRDLHFALRGPSVVDLRAAFCGNWLEAGGDLADARMAYRPGPDGDAHVLTLRGVSTVGYSDVATVLRLALRQARERVSIASPYFVPDAPLRDELLRARARGVAVRAVVAGDHHDEPVSRWAAQRTYGPLLERGVEIAEYAPTMFHSKYLCVDGRLSVVGSANFNQRSLRRDDECVLIVDHAPLASDLEDVFARDWSRSEVLDADRWSARGWPQRAREALSRLWFFQV
ncbi:MAG: cardiolipin synthase B [Sandaracinus sp.]|nr:cardiolipin synthase B [Myxococcales bacterium]MAT25952.1 cardiolipin synthase B [Sandaracinus sp.]MBJ74360.1 cardiolipin synthase B [Sandaracinus sp.]